MRLESERGVRCLASFHVIASGNVQIALPLHLLARPEQDGCGGLRDAIVPVASRYHTGESAQAIVAISQAPRHQTRPFQRVQDSQ